MQGGTSLTNQTMSTVLVRKAPALSGQDLVRAAILAPSPDNNQPWRFAFGDQRLTVFLDPSREVPSDVGSMLSYVALGAAVENACIAGRQAGYGSQVDFVAPPCLLSANNAPRPVARIKFARGAEADPLFEQLARRRTCRGMFDRQPISSKALDRLHQQATGTLGVRLDFVTQRRQIGALRDWSLPAIAFAMNTSLFTPSSIAKSASPPRRPSRRATDWTFAPSSCRMASSRC